MFLINYRALLTGGMVEESMRNGLKALLNGEDKLRWHRQTCNHILKDQSLVFQFLPLRKCKWRLHSHNPCPNPTCQTTPCNSTTIHLHRCN
uniref:Uncharacterized protein MANES_08G160800 n=1 Tax=Rhizophora mucronata TaxID=61149 RepID=A0A2P2KNN6_RHIMU